MKIAFGLSIILALLLFAPLLAVLAQNKGETTFKQLCVACYSIGKEKLVGSDLIKVQERHNEDRLLKFIKSSQSMIKRDDKYADSLFQAYNKIVMPDQPALTDGELKGICTYIKIYSSIYSRTFL